MFVCNVCDALNTQMKDHDEPDLRQKLEAHQEAAEMARTEIKNNIYCASVSTHLAVLTLTSSELYLYKELPLTLFFFTNSSCGYTTVGFTMKVQRMVTVISGWKGKLAIGAQENRNIKLVLMLKAALGSPSTLETVTMKFLIPGQSFFHQRCRFWRHDGDEEWGICGICLFGKENHKQDKRTLKVKVLSWLKTRNIEFDKSKPYCLVLKMSFNSVDDVSSDNLKPLWPNGKTISASKLCDLKSIMQLIPSDSRDFYNKLYTNGGTYDDIDGFGESLDFTLQNESV
ncbi:hypothetical protein PR048_003412 [Dryococelus australis]|uniref:Uncharacterized protein n=1 Tax=Dryococelus australis TaxID=614101 RepID=A0ABQ9IN18_9NEOP|nr:hypothetical protein PR048_003412 [Dryococelus australis]